MEKCDEFSKLMNDFKALRIDSRGATTALEDLNKQFTDFKLRFNIEELANDTQYQEIRAGIDRLESMIQLHRHKIQLHPLLMDYSETMKGCRAELRKLLDEPKALRVDPRAVEARVQDMYKAYKKYKLSFNSLVQNYQITNLEPYQGEGENKVDDLEPMFQLVFDIVAKKLQASKNV